MTLSTPKCVRCNSEQTHIGDQLGDADFHCSNCGHSWDSIEDALGI